MLALLVVRLTKLLKFKLTSLLESLVMHLSLGNFLRLADEIVQAHVQIIKTI